MFKKMSTIAQQVRQVTERVSVASKKRAENLKFKDPRIVAVSKTKSIDMIIEAYDAGQRHFGENYVNELVEKATDIELQDHCDEIKWHFIGHLQSNKASKVLGLPNLYAVETVDSDKIAKSLNNAWERLKKAEPLNVMIQVNTSGESNKSGIALGKTIELTSFIKDNCPHLKMLGIMTIGAYNYDPNSGPNPDFLSLVKEREAICEAFNIPLKDIELSMGMSSDFEQAIEMGSTNVRVGSTIFGTRDTSLKKGTFETGHSVELEKTVKENKSASTSCSQQKLTNSPEETLKNLSIE